MGSTSSGVQRQQKNAGNVIETGASARHLEDNNFVADGTRTRCRFRGTIWNRSEGKWYAKSYQGCEQDRHGPFANEESAAKAWDRSAVQRGLWDEVNFQGGNLADIFECNSYSQRRSVVSKYRGVTFNKPVNKWQAQVWHDGRNRSLGHFVDEVSAARAYDKFPLHHQLFDRLNFDDYTILDVKLASALSPFADSPGRNPYAPGLALEKNDISV
eukprot:CAMPEP_0118947536 /NCGR_PEP_ID=MMETSP1169-20130426/46231_1 /TAXON_ID=36882 /ORGANISM="Pyramimonas obovata, Strain CCMP722" /LENGTH=213 /DNA_ID=CAMNT_0006893775 /DNA_START=117 /DNA_END=754 /DNA_ORIENTATION=-